jgi:DNA-binding winged helix-turn-helix (wHTH) protein
VRQTDYTSDDAINRSISILRVALSSKLNTFIKTMPKIGYRFSIPQEITIELVSSCQGTIVVKNTLDFASQLWILFRAIIAGTFDELEVMPDKDYP